MLGSGVAGSSVALAAADAGASVALVAKDRLGETNTYYAQGGVAAVLAPEDSFAAHVADTLEVGCGIGEAGTVERVVRGGPSGIQRLIDYGARFDQRGDGSLDLSREGGHSQSRV
ncbi:MAG TPA: FAD-binding protein, partial [Candidatus Methylomirabilis sp.]